MNWMTLTPEVIPFAVFVISFAIEPRKFRTGLYLFVALSWVGVLALGWLIDLATTIWDDQVAGNLMLGVVAVLGLSVSGLAVGLVVAGITLVVKEGFAPRRLLSALLGLGMLAYLAGIIAAINQADTRPFFWLAMIGLPAAYLGIGFVSYVIYGSFYPWWMGRFGSPARAVIVLGSGLVNGAVPPLLASRLLKGRQVFDRAAQAGLTPVLITSGGQGPDEPIAEGEAMRNYLMDRGMPGSVMIAETASRNTDENVTFSARLLVERNIVGPVAVVTNDFHAFRAALVMRAHHVPGYAVGSKTARYFWPTAVIREYIAVLRDHIRLNAVLLGLSCIPLGLALVAHVMG